MTDTIKQHNDPNPAEGVHTLDTPDNTSSKAGREAAQYRVKLRATEQQLEATQAALTAARAQILTTALTGHKIGRDTFNPAAIDDAGLDTDTFFTEDGTLDQEALDQAMQELHDEKPHLFTPPQKLIIPSEGGAPEQQTASKTWQDAFTPEQ